MDIEAIKQRKKDLEAQYDAIQKQITDAEAQKRRLEGAYSELELLEAKLAESPKEDKKESK